jgi:hypothetical protein
MRCHFLRPTLISFCNERRHTNSYVHKYKIYLFFFLLKHFDAELSAVPTRALGGGVYHVPPSYVLRVVN